VMVALSVASNHHGPRCYDGCSLITSLTYGGSNYAWTLSTLPGTGGLYRKCSAYFIKYCKVDETCNTITGKTTGKGIDARTQVKDAEGTFTHTHCGPKDEDPVEFCSKVQKIVQDDFDKLSKRSDTLFKGRDLVTTCEQTINVCDGKSEPCVIMDNHPEWRELPAEPAKDPEEKMSHGDVPKICTLLLAYPFLALMM